MIGAIIALHWSASDVVNSFQGMEPDLLKAVIEWCYTTRLEVHSAYLNACLTLLNRLQLVPLAIQLSEEAKKEGAGQIKDVHLVQLCRKKCNDGCSMLPSLILAISSYKRLKHLQHMSGRLICCWNYAAVMVKQKLFGRSCFEDRPCGLSGGKYGKLIVEPGRDLAKAQLQEDLSRTAEACTSGRESDYPLFNDVVILVSAPLIASTSRRGMLQALKVAVSIFFGYKSLWFKGQHLYSLTESEIDHPLKTGLNRESAQKL